MIILTLLLVAGGYFCWQNYSLGGGQLIANGMKDSGMMFLKIIPIIILFALITGQIQANYKVKPNNFGQMVGGKSMTRAVVAGILTPGGVTMGPVLQSEWKNGGNKYSIIAFLLASGLLGWTTLMFRISFLGEELTIVFVGIGVALMGISVAVLTLIQRFQTVTT